MAAAKSDNSDCPYRQRSPPATRMPDIVYLWIQHYVNIPGTKVLAHVKMPSEPRPGTRVGRSAQHHADGERDFRLEAAAWAARHATHVASRGDALLSSPSNRVFCPRNYRTLFIENSLM